MFGIISALKALEEDLPSVCWEWIPTIARERFKQAISSQM